MADYSIDDILAELDAKKSGDSDNTGRSYGDDTPPRHHDISATAIIEGLDGSAGRLRRSINSNVL